ncbi:xanthine dehydrogenase accessory factor [Kitasatospora sp. GAS204A]|uniref:XdhC family protein n=1 Tax=unclassified Kitasatospora TaxID=2633591 RepID=UPI0024769171|nr:XdhC family protein [Kitasatospora sp. GAS204B]MDH6117902.1 xanthine dehydrogenase accessory factor [Kitasatospora sp. GAS204B]
MRQLAPQLLAWQESGARYAVASIVAVRGSAPMPLGSALCVDTDGTALGSVSGGCVEGAVYELAREVLSSGEPRLAGFGPSDDDVFAAGLTCGGGLEVFVQAVQGDTARVLAAAFRAVAARRPVVLARVLDGPNGWAGRAIALVGDRHLGSTGERDLDRAVLADARSLLGVDVTTVSVYDTGGVTRVLLESWAPSPRLLVFGANDHAAAVAEIGAFLGFHVTVCDARATFTTRERFPAAHEVVVDWPHRYLAATRTDRRTAVCVMTHDPKFDVPLLVEALRRPLSYVGALGSRRVRAARERELIEAGVSPDALAGLRSPVGLDLGAGTPRETAVSIAAELIAVRNGRSGQALSAIDDPIHPRREASWSAPLLR